MFKPESQAFTSLQGDVLVLELQHIVDGNDLHFVIIWEQQVEIYGVFDSGTEDAVHVFRRNFVSAEIVEHLCQLAFAFHIIMTLFVDHDSANHVAEVVDTIVFE